MLKLNGKQITTERYPNNETKVKDFKEYIQKEENILEFKYLTDADLVTLMFVKQRIDEANVPCRLFIWYMPYSRMDRKIEGDLFTLKYTCNFINWLHFTKVVVMEPHSEKTVQMLERMRPVYPVKDWVKAEELGEQVQIIFPDKGAAARYINSGYKNVCIMEKKRDPITGVIQNMHIKEGTVIPGAKCIIIDDLCSKGGTFAWAGSILKDAGASEVVLVVSHCEETIFKGTFNLLTPLGVKKMINLFTHLYCFGSGNNTCVNFETVRACRQSEISEGESIVGPLTSTTKLSIDEIMALGYGNKNGLAICRYKFHEGASIFDMEELGKEYLKPEEREVLLLMGNKLVAHCLGYDGRYLGKDGKPALIYEVDVYAPDFTNISGDYETLENMVYNEQTIRKIKEFYEALNGEGEFPNVPECYKDWKEAFKKLVFLEIKKLA